MISYLLLLLGTTYLVSQSAIFTLPRLWLLKHALFLGALVSCPACTSFWVGLLFGALGWWPFSAHITPWIDSAIGACAIGALWGVVVPAHYALEDNRATEETDG